jgi:nitric oxide reductase large subunit
MKSIQNILMLIVIISSLTWAVSIKTWKDKKIKDDYRYKASASKWIPKKLD